MWYFAWLLGLPLAAIFAVMNAMWLEMKEDEQTIAAGSATRIQDPSILILAEVRRWSSPSCRRTSNPSTS